MFFQGAMFIVFPNVPGATFIRVVTLIPESRVVQNTQSIGEFFNPFQKTIQIFKRIMTI